MIGILNLTKQDWSPFMRKIFSLWKFIFPLAILAAIFATSHTQVQALDDTEVFFRTKKEAHVPIIMYHLVTENSRYIGKFGIRPSELEADLKYLKDNNYNTIVIGDLINFVENGNSLPENPIILTFDDGNTSDLKILLPLLEKYNMKAVASIIGQAADKNTKEQAENPTATYPNLTWSQITELHKSGKVEIQNHGYNVHGPTGSGKLKQESQDTYRQRLKTDLKKLQDLCEKHLGYTPNTFCYPLGIISKGSQAVLEELGFKASLSCEEGMNIIQEGDKNSLFMLKRVNRPSGRSIETILNKLHK